MDLIPIEIKGLPGSISFKDQSVIQIISRTQDYYDKIGFQKPWIGYCAVSQNQVVGTCAFK